MNTIRQPFLRAVNPQRPALKITSIAGDDGLGTGGKSGFSQYGIFKIGQGAAQGLLDHRPRHGGHFEQQQQLLNVLSRALVTHRFSRQGVKRGEGGGANARGVEARFNLRQHRCGCFGKQGSVE